MKGVFKDPAKIWYFLLHSEEEFLGKFLEELCHGRI